MELNVTSWGNSLGLRLPKAVAEMLGVAHGSKLEATFVDGKLVLSPLEDEPGLEALAAGIDLEAMVKRVTSKNRHDRCELDDAPVGDEVW
jgi:antitoxin MazE